MYPSLFGALVGINLAERRRLRTAAAKAAWSTLMAWLEGRASIAAMHAAGFRFAVKEPERRPGFVDERPGARPGETVRAEPV